MNNFPDHSYNLTDHLEYDSLVGSRPYTVCGPYYTTLQKCVNCGKGPFGKLRQDGLWIENIDPGVLIHLTDEEANVLKWLAA